MTPADQRNDAQEEQEDTWRGVIGLFLALAALCVMTILAVYVSGLMHHAS